MSFDKLSETTLLTYSAFFSYLRDENTLESDYKNFLDKDGDPRHQKRPVTGKEINELIKQV